MTTLALIRHGPTAWNTEGRLQGRADIPLSPDGEAALAGRRLPPPFSGMAAYSSPLVRARRTAALLGIRAVTIEPRLTELDWGEFEGRTVDDLRARYGAGMAANEARGLDFRPPGGESPRDMQKRIRPFLNDLAESRRSAIAVTHKGMIRAILALATGWDMMGRQPVKLDWRCLHAFTLDGDGTPSVARLNIALEGP
ncbi:MAG TPA: histidine phosphatase family protein [Candidatus Cybelea sp.]|nr:histidine phosphatase family protein [Candidatus Cybelea sp.]